MTALLSMSTYSCTAVSLSCAAEDGRGTPSPLVGDEAVLHAQCADSDPFMPDAEREGLQQALQQAQWTRQGCPMQVCEAFLHPMMSSISSLHSSVRLSFSMLPVALCELHTTSLTRLLPAVSVPAVAPLVRVDISIDLLDSACGSKPCQQSPPSWAAQLNHATIQWRGRLVPTSFRLTQLDHSPVHVQLGSC